MQLAGGRVYPSVQALVETTIFAEGEKCKRISLRPPRKSLIANLPQLCYYETWNRMVLRNMRGEQDVKYGQGLQSSRSGLAA